MDVVRRADEFRRCLYTSASKVPEATRQARIQGDRESHGPSFSLNEREVFAQPKPCARRSKGLRPKCRNMVEQDLPEQFILAATMIRSGGFRHVRRTALESTSQGMHCCKGHAWFELAPVLCNEQQSLSKRRFRLMPDAANLVASYFFPRPFTFNVFNGSNPFPLASLPLPLLLLNALALRMRFSLSRFIPTNPTSLLTAALPPLGNK